MKQYLDIVENVIQNGHVKCPVRKNIHTGKFEPVDGGVKTLALPNVFFTHNMEDGFPLLTTKKMAWHAIKVELEGFIKGITDKKWYQDRGCRIWDEFSSVSGSIAGASWDQRKRYQLASRDLGPIYGWEWRNFGGNYVPTPKPNIPYCKIEESIDGKIYNNEKYGDFIIIGKKKKLLQIQFLRTTYKYWCRASSVNSGKVRDPYHISQYGVGCMGPTVKYDGVSSKKRRRIYNYWLGLLSRCYNPSNLSYKNYGARGFYMSNDWLIFSNFLRDIQEIRGWRSKVNHWCGYHLHVKGQMYDKSTCEWKRDVQIHSDVILPPSGTDQLKNIVDTLHNNPNDRRMVCSAWNPNDLHMMALPPCHWGWNVTVIGGKLHLCWIQRSCDLMLGVPFNIASYALLLTLLAKEANLEPGNLSGVLVDCHIYENQLDGVKEQLTREPRNLPSIRIKYNGKFSIFNWTHEDVELINYNPHPAIKFGEVVV